MAAARRGRAWCSVAQWICRIRGENVRWIRRSGDVRDDGADEVVVAAGSLNRDEKVSRSFGDVPLVVFVLYAGKAMG